MGITLNSKAKKLLTLVTVWALLATGILAYVATIPQGPAPSLVWDSDTRLLIRISGSLASARTALRAYVTTQNDSSGLESVDWVVNAWQVANYGQADAAGGFPSASALNLTSPTLGCAYYGLFYAHSVLSSVPNAWSDRDLTAYLNETGSLFANLSANLNNVGIGLGTDPLSQLGTDRVDSIRENATALHALSQPFVPSSFSYACTRA